MVIGVKAAEASGRSGTKAAAQNKSAENEGLAHNKATGDKSVIKEV